MHSVIVIAGAAVAAAAIAKEQTHRHRRQRRRHRHRQHCEQQPKLKLNHRAIGAHSALELVRLLARSSHSSLNSWRCGRCRSLAASQPGRIAALLGGFVLLAAFVCLCFWHILCRKKKN